MTSLYEHLSSAVSAAFLEQANEDERRQLRWAWEREFGNPTQGLPQSLATQQMPAPKTPRVYTEHDAAYEANAQRKRERKNLARLAMLGCAM